MSSGIKRDFNVACVAPYSLGDFMRKSGHAALETMLREALAYYDKKLTASPLPLVRANEQKGHYAPLSDEPLFPNQVHIRLHFTDTPAQTFMKIKRRSGLPSLDVMISHALALYYNVLEARERGEVIGIVDEAKNTWTELVPKLAHLPS
jgi:hypothetical protein